MENCHYISNINLKDCDEGLITVNFLAKNSEYKTLEDSIKNHYTIPGFAKKNHYNRDV